MDSQSAVQMVQVVRPVKISKYQGRYHPVSVLALTLGAILAFALVLPIPAGPPAVLLTPPVLTLSIIGVVVSRPSRGAKGLWMAIVGLALGSVGLILSIAFVILAITS